MNKKPIYKRKKILIPLIVLAIVITGNITLINITHGTTGEIFSKKLNKTPYDNNKIFTGNTISVMTINMAHGRANGRNQILQSKENIQKNIDVIGEFIKSQSPHIVALQEADAPSWWSGGFSHVNRVGEISNMQSAVHGLNVSGIGLNYGTALISKFKTEEARQETFEKNIPTFSKGFVAATYKWPGENDFEYIVISLHLDFSRDYIREKQMNQLNKFIKEKSMPVILMGDFNTDTKSDYMTEFMKELQLSTWKTDDLSLVTFPALSRRIDWIMVSSEFKILNHEIVDIELSDHKVVKAQVGLKQHSQQIFQ